MFNRVGKKIKGLCVAVTVIGIIASFIIGLTMIIEAAKSRNSTAGIIIGILVIVLGSLESWLISLFSYGYGQMIDSLQNIEEKITGETESYVSDNMSNFMKSVLDQQHIDSLDKDQNNTNHNDDQPVAQPQQESVPGPDEWKCKNCGKINKNYVGTCGCGQPKVEN